MVTVLDIEIFSGNLPSAVDKVVDDLMSNTVKQSRCVSATGAHGLVTSTEDPDFKKILQQFYLNLPDGMPLVWVGRLKGFKSMDRCYGPDFFRELLKATADSAINHFFCGGNKGVAEELKQSVESNWSNNHVVGTYCPPFREMADIEWKALVHQIIMSRTDIVWIGLSTPKQEKFAAKLASMVNVKYIITVGAAFDFFTGRVKQAPKWMQKAGLEWFYRLCQEPKRLFKRYLKIVPKFTVLAISELLCRSRKKNL
jgi:N-acetylglucosaminyldiphosphoundecaprenol N-acetyl-beta-D-mannosaminyltransferase